MKRFLGIVLVAVMLFLLGACTPQEEATPGVSGSTAEPTGYPQIEGPTGTPAKLSNDYPLAELSGAGDSYVQRLHYRDYTSMWWRDGFKKGGSNVVNFQTGYYAMAVDTGRGGITRLGALADAPTYNEMMHAYNNEIPDSAPAIQMNYSISDGEGSHYFSHIAGVGGSGYNSRIIESGRYMQRMDMMYLTFNKLPDVRGRVEIGALSNSVSVNFSAYSKKDAEYTLSFSFLVGESYPFYAVREDGRAVTVCDNNYKGFTVYLPEQENASLIYDEGIITLSCKLKLEGGTFTGFSAILVPSVHASLADAEICEGREQVKVSAVQLSPKEGREHETAYDVSTACMDIDMDRMTAYRTTAFGRGEEAMNTYDRLLVTFENPTDHAVKLPVRLNKSKNFPVEGMSPMIRDAQTGEPIGIPVQLSRNWHQMSKEAEQNDPASYLSGIWMHAYTQIEIPAHSSVRYEITLAYAQWGGVYAASHGQLCLAGWGGNYQQWETSAIGAFGEQFCYDPESAHGLSFIDDINALCVYGRSGQKYDWNAGWGGSDMMVYYDAAGQRQPLVLVKTNFKNHAPNLTEVNYTALTKDKAIQIDITVNMGRTNDASRAYHTMKYTFLKDTSFSRLAFYQFGADKYNSGWAQYLTLGNDDGPIDFEIDGKQYSGTFQTVNGAPVKYLGERDVPQRIDFPGTGAWMIFTGAMDNEMSGVACDRMLNVISFEAKLNGTAYTQPAFNLRTAQEANAMASMLVELTAPSAAGDVIKAGSTVELVVEFINLARAKSEYYGSSDVMNAIPAEEFDTWRIAHRYAMGGKYQAEVSVGTLLRGTPIKVQCDAEAKEILAQVSVRGGIGYVPLTFAGVPSYHGYRLEQKKDGAWVKVDQSVHGNDYWQTWFDDTASAYEYTYNVEHSGDPQAVYEYRLVKEG